jgi:hypothetical protein
MRMGTGLKWIRTRVQLTDRVNALKDVPSNSTKCRDSLRSWVNTSVWGRALLRGCNYTRHTFPYHPQRLVIHTANPVPP